MTCYSVNVVPPSSSPSFAQVASTESVIRQGTSAKAPSRIGAYDLIRCIGEGTFGKVWLGCHRLTDERVAIKILEKRKIVDRTDVERVSRELHILKKLRHPHIIQLFEIIETGECLFLITEYAECGELFDLVVKKDRLDEEESCRMLHQLLASVEHMHRSGVAHRDLKPENILLDSRKNIKIVDFGLSNLYSFSRNELLETACGSPCYASPEMIAGKKYAPLAADLWSCGVIMYALVSGFLPFEDPSTSKLYQKILAASYSLPDWVSSSCASLIDGLLQVDPGSRMTLEGVRRHPFYCNMTRNLSASHQMMTGQVVPCGLPACDLCDVWERNSSNFSEQDKIFSQMSVLGFSRDLVLSEMKLGKLNHLTTTFYLLQRRNLRNEEQLQHHLSSSITPRHRSGTLSNSSSSATTRPLQGIDATTLFSPRYPLNGPGPFTHAIPGSPRINILPSAASPPSSRLQVPTSPVSPTSHHPSSPHNNRRPPPVIPPLALSSLIQPACQKDDYIAVNANSKRQTTATATQPSPISGRSVRTTTTTTTTTTTGNVSARSTPPNNKNNPIATFYASSKSPDNITAVPPSTFIVASTQRSSPSSSFHHPTPLSTNTGYATARPNSCMPSPIQLIPFPSPQQQQLYQSKFDPFISQRTNTATTIMPPPIQQRYETFRSTTLPPLQRFPPQQQRFQPHQFQHLQQQNLFMGQPQRTQPQIVFHQREPQSISTFNPPQQLNHRPLMMMNNDMFVQNNHQQNPMKMMSTTCPQPQRPLSPLQYVAGAPQLLTYRRDF